MSKTRKRIAIAVLGAVSLFGAAAFVPSCGQPSQQICVSCGGMGGGGSW